MFITFKNFLSNALVFSLLFLVSILHADTYIVTTTSDTGAGSLRQAITDANTHVGPNTIVFHISQTDTGYDAENGTWTIKPASKLPEITSSGLVIEGGSQAVFIGTDTNPQGPEIVLDGSLFPNTYGLTIKASEVKIWELVINHFANIGSAIRIDGVVGGEICGCYIGTDAKGIASASNSYGIYITSGSREVRVFRKNDKPNIISSNTNCGIAICDSSMNNAIMGNIIGLNRTCDDTLGNGMKNGYGGIFISSNSDSNRVINNLIGGNRHYGIMIYGASGNTFSENFIGITDSWSKSLGNTYSGIYIITELTSDKAIGNNISHNQIGYNGGYGVQIWGAGSYNNHITENAISMNQQNGISLYNGGNKSMEHPVIQTATPVNVAGQSSPNSTVEVFCDGQNQGRFFLGTVTANGSGNFSLDLNMPPPASNITATATDAEGNTSEFSTPVVTGIEENLIGSAPTVFLLSQNYPNPFNPSTTIQFQIPVSATVEINIYNTLSQKVRTLVNGRYDVGIHSIVWDGLDDGGNQSACGIYVYTMKSADYKDIKKLILLK